MKKPSEKKDFISGIYNYCDRWCERCAFTNRCLNYASQKEFEEAREQNLTEEEFSEKIERFYEEQLPPEEENPLKALSDDEEEEMDFDLPELTEEEMQEYERSRKQKEDAAEANPLAKLSDKYARLAQKWIDENEKLFEHGEGQLNSSSNLEVNIADSLEVTDALSIITWYHAQIHVKFMRSIFGKLEDQEEEPDSNYPKDSDGSCKVALIACDNSIEAWKTLQKRFPQQRLFFSRFINGLNDIRRIAEEQFPEARKFKRPGFDE